MSRNRDADVDALLRSALGAAAPGVFDSCPPAEDLAAFEEGSLVGREQQAMIEHLASCGRCQKVVAAMSGMPRPSAATPRARGTWLPALRLRWLLPSVAAVGLAVFVYTATRPPVLPQAPMASLARTDVPSRGEPAKPVVAPPVDEAAPSRPNMAAMPAKERSVDAAPPRGVLSLKTETKAESGLGDQPASLSADRLKPVPFLEQPPSAAPPRPGEQTKQAAAPRAAPAPTFRTTVGELTAASGAPPVVTPTRVVASEWLEARAPDGTSVWRFGRGGAIARSTDGGATWQRQASGTSVVLRAAAAPGPATCWAVGSEGVVLLTTDGESWQRRPFPEPVDLVAVHATDARNATVTTRDARTFTTQDGGATWVSGK